MEKFLKNIQWMILAIALYNLYSINEEYDPKPEAARQETARLRQKLNKNKKIKKEIDEFYANIDEAKQKIERVKQSLEKTQQLLPAEISDSEYVALLRQTADELNIKNMKIKPDKEVVNGLFISKKYQFEATATFVQFVVFFERISNNKRVLNIKDISLSKEGAQGHGKFQFIQGSFALEAYRFNPNYKDPEDDKKKSPDQLTTPDKKG